VSYGVASNAVNVDDGAVSFDGPDWLLSGDRLKYKLEMADYEPVRLMGVEIQEPGGMTRQLWLDRVNQVTLIESKPAIKIRSLKDTLLHQYE
jgi:hypothetical protein